MINEHELIAFIAEKTKLDPTQIQLALKYEKEFMSKAKPNKKGEIDVDFDDLVDALLAKKDLKLNELQIDRVLETEMAYLLKNGHAKDEQ